MTRLSDLASVTTVVLAVEGMAAAAGLAVLLLVSSGEPASAGHTECIHTRAGNVEVRVYPGDPAGELVPTGEGC